MHVNVCVNVQWYYVVAPRVVLTLSFKSLHTAAKLWVLLSRSSQSNFQHEVGFRTIGSPNSCEDTCEGN